MQGELELRREIYDQTLGHFLGPVRPFFDDPTVSEIMINGPYEIFVERKGRLERTDVRFEDETALTAAARNIAQFVGKRLSPESQSVEARLPDGSRVHMVLPPAAKNGLSISIRRFAKSRLTIADLIEFRALSAEAAEFLGLCVEIEKNCLVSGGTGSGKTTLLNVLSGLVPDDSRVIVIEDASELQLQKSHVVSFEAQPPDRHGRGGVTIRDLFRASLRMRPDRIVIGEIRGGEALDLIQAMTSGHGGSLSTLHANSPYDALNRLETMAMMSGVSLPLTALRAQIGSAIDVIVQIARFHSGRRCVTSITEVVGSDANGYQLAEIYGFSGTAEEGGLEWTGLTPTFAGELSLKGMANIPVLTSRIWGFDDSTRREQRGVHTPIQGGGK